MERQPTVLVRRGGRRQRPRIHEKFPVKVRGTDLNGERFQIDTVPDNVGSKGRISGWRGESSLERFFIVVRLSSSTEATGFAQGGYRLRGASRRTAAGWLLRADGRFRTTQIFVKVEGFGGGLMSVYHLVFDRKSTVG